MENSVGTVRENSVGLSTSVGNLYAKITTTSDKLTDAIHSVQEIVDEILNRTPLHVPEDKVEKVEAPAKKGTKMTAKVEKVDPVKVSKGKRKTTSSMPKKTK